MHDPQQADSGIVVSPVAAIAVQPTRTEMIINDRVLRSWPIAHAAKESIT
jgi:hypothetical protein